MFSRLTNQRLLGLLAMTLSSIAIGASPDGTPLRTDHLSSQLVAERTAVSPGQTLRIGLRLQHDLHWHTYWRNAGDSGLPTRIDLQLPEGVLASGIEWPSPQRFDVETIVNFGYGDTIILPITLTIPANYPAKTLPIMATANWLVCEVECIPGRGDYRIELPVVAAGQPRATEPDARWNDDFAAAEVRQPSQFSGSAHLSQRNDQIVIDLIDTNLPADIAAWEVFPADPQVVVNGAYPMWRRIDGGLRMSLPQSDYFNTLPAHFEFLLVKGKQAIAVNAQLTPPR